MTITHQITTLIDILLSQMFSEHNINHDMFKYFCAIRDNNTPNHNIS